MPFCDRNGELVMRQKIEPILKDDPWPEKKDSWPQCRTLADYCRFLLKTWSFKTLAEEPSLPNIIAFLELARHANKPEYAEDQDDFLRRINPEDKPVVLDCGLGDANALKEMKDNGFITVGFGLHHINPENASSVDLLVYSPIPNGNKARMIFDYLRGKVALVCDTFGASTYAADKNNTTNPIEALIFEGLLLAPGGEARSIVSCIPQQDTEQSPIGFAPQRQRLVNFFKQELGLDMRITRTHVKSTIMPGQYCIEYLVEVQRAIDAKVSLKPLDELFLLAAQHVGSCTVLEKPSKVGEYDGFAIRGRSYTRRGEEIQLLGMQHHLFLTSSQCFFVEDQPQISLNFKSKAAQEDFSIRFSEYYLNIKEDIEWTLESSNNGHNVMLRYSGKHANRADAMMQAKIEINRISPNLLDTSFASRFFVNQSEHDSNTVSSSKVFDLM